LQSALERQPPGGGAGFADADADAGAGAADDGAAGAKESDGGAGAGGAVVDAVGTTMTGDADGSARTRGWFCSPLHADTSTRSAMLATRPERRARRRHRVWTSIPAIYQLSKTHTLPADLLARSNGAR
jgi:hypothetical protein